MGFGSSNSQILTSVMTPTVVAHPDALESIRVRMHKDPQGAVHKVAQQFEALFLDTVMRAMRETQLNDEEQTSELNTWRGMLDQQLSQTISTSRGVGLAAVLEQQILRLAHLEPPADTDAVRSAVAPLTANPSLTLPARALRAYERAHEAVSPTQKMACAALPVRAAPVAKEPQQFVQLMLTHAADAAAQLGIAAEFIVAHAALESDWGKKAIRYPNGQDSHNLFGIKAGQNWHGPTVDVLTTEYVNGVAQKRVGTFRAYASYREAFADYANLLSGATRYRDVLNQGQNGYGFAQGLQNAGYATDPRYAKKLVNVMASLGKA